MDTIDVMTELSLKLSQVICGPKECALEGTVTGMFQMDLLRVEMECVIAD